MAHVRDESIFFYDWIDKNSLIVILTKPELGVYEEVFQDVCRKKGCTVYSINDDIDMDKDYSLSERAKSIIDSVLEEFDGKNVKIITHPKFTRESDPQNRELFDYVAAKYLDNHYIYKKSDVDKLLSNGRKRSLMKYCMIFKNEDDRLERFYNYVTIAQKIHTLRKI
jgi:hypothetical protein